MLEIVDLHEYRAFCFRGEGRCNIVISAKGRTNNLRIVWRLAKKRRSNLINFKPKCDIINKYMEQFISPFLDDNYLIKAKLVNINSDELHHLAKIPSLPKNHKIEDFNELISTYPTNSSRFPHKSHNCSRTILALEMPDATRIPRLNAHWFFQSHPGVDVPFCNNCILQIEKWKSASFSSMYDYCPLALYSGERSKMEYALASLIYDPHRNLRIFVDGNSVHDDSDSPKNFDEKILSDLIFPGTPNANIQIFIKIVTCILAGVNDDQKPFSLQQSSVLFDLLKAQKIDNIGIVRAYELYKSLPQNIQRELQKKSNLLGRGLDFLSKRDPRSLVERYLLAATMKDCSLMISIRLVDKIGENIVRNVGGGSGFVSVRALDGQSLYFAFSVRIVDLDPKTGKNLESAYSRFMAGIGLIKSHPNVHRPCITY
uniref:Inositol-pentakisphosphate 2-kinase n=1 Tax=Meloidogyne floridensis TaxID=298350 RepID=A0A915PEY7_9BILA